MHMDGKTLAATDSKPAMNLFERYLTLWVALCIVAGITLGHLMPVLPAGVRKEHWPLRDPAKVTGSEYEIMAAFRESRDDIRDRVGDLIERLKSNGR